MKHTTNYSLPQYEAGDQVDLVAGYNEAMSIIDEKLKELEDGGGGSSSFTPSGGTVLTIDQIKAAKVSENGGVLYYTAE